MKKKWTIATVLLLAVALLAVGTWAASSATAKRSTVAMVHFFFMHKPPFSLIGCF